MERVHTGHIKDGRCVYKSKKAACSVDTQSLHSLLRCVADGDVQDGRCVRQDEAALMLTIGQEHSPLTEISVGNLTNTVIFTANIS